MMIADANSDQYMYMIQAMIDLDFNDSLDPSRLNRIVGMIDNGIWDSPRLS